MDSGCTESRQRHRERSGGSEISQASVSSTSAPSALCDRRMANVGCQQRAGGCFLQVKGNKNTSIVGRLARRKQLRESGGAFAGLSNRPGSSRPHLALSRSTRKSLHRSSAKVGEGSRTNRLSFNRGPSHGWPLACTRSLKSSMEEKEKPRASPSMCPCTFACPRTECRSTIAAACKTFPARGYCSTLRFPSNPVQASSLHFACPGKRTKPRAPWYVPVARRCELRSCLTSLVRAMQSLSRLATSIFCGRTLSAACSYKHLEPRVISFLTSDACGALAGSRIESPQEWRAARLPECR